MLNVYGVVFLNRINLCLSRKEGKVIFLRKLINHALEDNLEMTEKCA